MLLTISSIKSFCVTVHGVQTTLTVSTESAWSVATALNAFMIAPTVALPEFALNSLTFFNEVCVDTPMLAPTMTLAIAVPCPATSS